jgi:hypothetical protein
MNVPRPFVPDPAADPNTYEYCRVLPVTYRISLINRDFNTSGAPDGRTLRTLRDAGEYIQELPRATHQRPEWRIAAEMLLEAVEGKGPLMFAEIAMRKAVNAGKPAPEPTPRRRGRR